MSNDSTRLWPAFAPINLDYDQERLKEEILSSGILYHNKVATSLAVNGKSHWDDGVHFKSEQFEKHAKIPLWAEQDKALTPAEINTFFQVNTTYPTDDPDIEAMWADIGDGRGRLPLWIAYHHPWKKRPGVVLPYLYDVIDQLGLEFISMIRIVNQLPPSIGLIHKDSGPKTNHQFFEDGGVSITLNVASGGANLYFINSNDEELTVDEANTKAWHFDDSFLHCTNEVTSPRLQIRVYGKHKNYKSLMQMNSAIW